MPSPATPAALALLFGTLTVSALIMTGLFALATYFLMSIWWIVFVLSFLLVWMVLDNFTIYQDLRSKQLPTEQLKANEQTHMNTISAMAIQAQLCDEARKLAEKIHANQISDLVTKAQEINETNECLRRRMGTLHDSVLANLHWSLMYNKLMTCYHIQHTFAKLNMRKPAPARKLKKTRSCDDL
jgi:hypothetical protein